MKKTKNRNQRIAQPKKNSPKNKPFIGVNVYTKEDDMIIEKMLQNPNWSVEAIRDALPYKHSTKNVMNKLRQFRSKDEIEAHLVQKQENETVTLTPIPKAPAKRAYVRWTDEEINIIKANIHKIKPSSEAWNKLIPNHSTRSTYNKVMELKNKTRPTRKYGWLESDIELLKIAMLDIDTKSVQEIAKDLTETLDEKHTFFEINQMARRLGLNTQNEKPKEKKMEKNYNPRNNASKSQSRFA